MAATDVLASMSDKLVGGMMFHSDHADLSRMMGIEWLAELHEDGFAHDCEAFRKVRREGIRHTGMLVPGGRQERTHVLDKWASSKAWDAQPDAESLRSAMLDWCDWEASAADTYRNAYRRLMDMGEMSLAKLVRKLAEDTELELAEARELMQEMSASGWDMPHVLSMGNR